MRTYLLNLYYSNLADNAINVANIKNDVIKISDNNWRLIKAGQNLLSIAFATNNDPIKFQKMLINYDQDHFQYLLVEVSGVHAGWIDKSVYQWLQGRLERS